MSTHEPPIEDLPDTDLPGMWSHSDFEGGISTYVGSDGEQIHYTDDQSIKVCDSCGAVTQFSRDLIPHKDTCPEAV